jgi:phosphate/sulfate permease
MMYLIFLLAIFFTVNMGSSTFAASFAAAYGSKVVSWKKAVVLFLIFVTLGAVVFGQKVSVTLGNKIIPAEYVSPRVLIIIFLAAGLSLLVANLMKIPQTTSIVTVATIAGVGTYLNRLNIDTILFMLPFWIILPIVAFGLTYLIGRLIYPPRKGNFWIYERVANQQNKLKNFVIISSCYNAFSIGTNNVANVIGPLKGAGFIDLTLGLFLFGLVYGAGGQVFKHPIQTASNKIVPLGLLSASLISLVCGTLILFASSLGVPQSFVMLKMAAIFAIGSLKHGKTETFNEPITKQTFITWTINPVITFFVSYGLCFLILR